jgi:AraC-like DNA-binding protein
MQQIEIDFSRGDQLGLLDAVYFVDSDGLSGCSTKAVLKAIDGFGRECFASRETIAARANVSSRTVSRAVKRLIGMSVITCEFQKNCFGTVTNHYRIVWSELELRVDRQLSTDRLVPPEPSVVPPEPTVVPRRPTVVPGATDRSARMATNTKEPQKIRHQPASEAAAGEVEILENAFRSIGLQRFAQLAREFRWRDCEVVEAISIYSAQRNKFAGPGAVVDFLRSGDWPADGILSATELSARSQRSCVAKSVKSREAVRCEVARDWKRSGRWIDASEREIDSEIDRRLAVPREMQLSESA